jgi:probable rRNA maturation factor
MKIELHMSRSPHLARAGIPQTASFRRWVELALKAAKRRRAVELSIRLVDGDEGRELNRQYRNRDYATNVLSFPAELPASMNLPLLGDLAICTPVVAREAAEQGKALRDHYAHMTVHGSLHLLGFDHEDEADADVMEALERRILEELDIADPYRIR